MNEVPYPEPSNSQVSVRMRRNPKFNTGLEMRLRSELHRRGLRYRVHWTILIPGSKVQPDIVFTRRRLAVFVDGCFWHSCPDHGNLPQHNVQYWSQKLERNRRRDVRVNDGLKESGWDVLRIWEHMPAAAAADQIVATVTMGL